MFDHIGVGVSDLKASKAFFLQALFPLGVGVVMEVSDAAGLESRTKYFPSAASWGSASPLMVCCRAV